MNKISKRPERAISQKPPTANQTTKPVTTDHKRNSSISSSSPTKENKPGKFNNQILQKPAEVQPEKKVPIIQHVDEEVPRVRSTRTPEQNRKIVYRKI